MTIRPASRPAFRSVPTCLTALALLLAPPLAAQQDTPPDAPAETGAAQTQEASPPEMSEIEDALARGDFAGARASLEQRVGAQGDAESRYLYARLLLDGRGGPRDLQGAVDQLAAAADQEHDAAAVLLARIFLTDSLVERDPARAVALLSAPAERGDAEARFYLGLLTHTGSGTPADPEKALTLLRSSAEMGNVHAQLEMAKILSAGTEGTPPDAQAALDWLRRAAEQGDITAQVSLGRAHATGAGAERDLAEALRWYLRAAEAGHVAAQRVVGQIYLAGEPERVAANPAEARRWLQTASQAGDAQAMLTLGQALAAGEVYERDTATAARLITRAAELGLPAAMVTLGGLYEAGIGVPQDPDLAIAAYRKAAEEAGSPEAALRLGELATAGKLAGKLAPQRMVPWVQLLAQTGDPVALDWLQARAEGGMPQAGAALGQLLLAAQEDDERAAAVPYLTAAAESGSIRAQTLLGNLYVRGDAGLTQDYVQGYKWLNIAATGGSSEAAGTRGVILELMTPEQIAEAQAASRAYYETEAQQIPQAARPESGGAAVPPAPDGDDGRQD